MSTWTPSTRRSNSGTIRRGEDPRPVNPNRERKSSGSETTFDRDLTDPTEIEAGILAMADDVWAWCEKTGRRGRTVTVKVKGTDFQQSTRSQSFVRALDSRERLHAASLGLIRSVFPPPKGVRLVGVTLSNLTDAKGPGEGEPALPLGVVDGV